MLSPGAARAPVRQQREKEHLAGFYLIECDSLERAVERAGQMPEAEFGLVEVRPIADLNEYDVG